MRYWWLILSFATLAACSSEKEGKSDDDKSSNKDSDPIEISEEQLDTCQCDLLSFDKEGIALFNNDQIFNGKCHSYNKANGNKYEERLYLKGVVNWIKFYNNGGDLITQYDYVNGERKELVANCDCNKIEYKKIKDVYIAHFDGKIFDGHCRSFYPKSGRVYQEGKFEDGIKEGMHAVYDKSGNILTFEYFENGKLTQRSKK